MIPGLGDLYRMVDSSGRPPSVRFTGRGSSLRCETLLAVQLRPSPTRHGAGRVEVRVVVVPARGTPQEGPASGANPRPGKRSFRHPRRLRPGSPPPVMICETPARLLYPDAVDFARLRLVGPALSRDLLQSLTPARAPTESERNPGSRSPCRFRRTGGRRGRSGCGRCRAPWSSSSRRCPFSSTSVRRFSKLRPESRRSSGL